MFGSKNLRSLLGLIGLVTVLAGCGEGSSSSSSSQTDPGTPTTLVTAANGTSTQFCAPNAQCISPLFAKLAQVSNKLSIAATPWTNTTTNIITISKTPYVEGAVTAAHARSTAALVGMAVGDGAAGFSGGVVRKTNVPAA